MTIVRRMRKENNRMMGLIIFRMKGTLENGFRMSNVLLILDVSELQ